MKRSLLALSVLLLVAAGCNSSATDQSRTDQTQPGQETQATPPTQAAQTPASTSTSTKATQDCVNKKYGYKLTIPATWQVFTTGSGEAVKVKCSDGLASYTFAEDLFSEKVQNKINIQVMNSANQDKSFWTGFNSLESYLSNKGLKSQVETYGTIDGEKIAWFYPQNVPISAGGQSTDAYTYHNNSLYSFTFSTVDPSIQNQFISSFKFSK